MKVPDARSDTLWEPSRAAVNLRVPAGDFADASIFLFYLCITPSDRCCLARPRGHGPVMSKIDTICLFHR